MVPNGLPPSQTSILGGEGLWEGQELAGGEGRQRVPTPGAPVTQGRTRLQGVWGWNKSSEQPGVGIA